MGGISYSFTNDNIIASPYILNSNVYPGLFVPGTVNAYFL
jgi:hypothetical protein